MTEPGTTSGKSGMPSLADLLSKYLRQKTSSGGVEFSRSWVGGEVTPHEALPSQPVDAKLAWDEAREAGNPTARVAGVGPFMNAIPPSNWASLVHDQEPTYAVAFCLGNYPQLVRNLQPLLAATKLADLRPLPVPDRSHPAVSTWASKCIAKKPFPSAVLVLGVARLAGQWELADEVIARHEGSVAAEWRQVWANEEAALAWHRGDFEKAVAGWRKQDDSAHGVLQSWNGGPVP